MSSSSSHSPTAMTTENADRTAILLIDDHALVRDGVRAILEAQHDMLVVGEASDSSSAIGLVTELRPNVALLDIEIPGGDAISTVYRIRENSPETAVVILSTFEGPHLLHGLLEAGVRGYLLKSATWQELVSAIRSVAGDEDRVVLSVSRDSLAYVRGPTEGTLSEREREILQLAAEALSNTQIATRLRLTKATVKRHLRNIFTKLGAVSRIDAVNKAVGESLIAGAAGAGRAGQAGAGWAGNAYRPGAEPNAPPPARPRNGHAEI